MNRLEGQTDVNSIFPLFFEGRINTGGFWQARLWSVNQTGVEWKI